MSEQNTSEPTVIAPGPKVKDPKRVVAGKRLGSISRKAKEEKALRLSQQSDNYNSESNDKTLYFVVGLVVVGAASYLLFLNKERSCGRSPVIKKSQIQCQSKSQLLRKKILKVFSTINK